MLRRLVDEMERYERHEFKDFLSTILERIELDPDQATLQVCYSIPLRGGNSLASPREHAPLATFAFANRG